MLNTIYLLIGFGLSALTYVLFFILDYLWFEPKRMKRSSYLNKKNILNFAVTEIQINKRKIENFILLIDRIEKTENKGQFFFLNLEYQGKYIIQLNNLENLIYSDINFSEEDKKELLGLYDKFNEYINNLMNIHTFITPYNPNNLYFNEDNFKQFKELSRNVRFTSLLSWFEELKNIDNIIIKLKNKKIN